MSVHLSTILDACPRSLELVSAGRAVFSPGDPSRWLYRIETGHVRLRVGEGDDAARVFLGPGDLFGYSPGCRSCFAEAAVDSVLTSWATDRLLELCGGSVDLMAALLTRPDQAASDLDRMPVRLGCLSPMERALWFLDWMVRIDRRRTAFRMPTSRRDIADFLMLSETALGAAVRQLVDLGYIGVDRAGRLHVFHGGRRFTDDSPRAYAAT
jgi:CRP-like cAMP-binding protein